MRIKLTTIALLLAACGGGGDDPAPAAGPTPPPAAPSEIACGLPNFQADMLRLVNERRAAGATCGASGRFGAAPALAWDDRLATAAYGHSRDMADRNYFAHAGVDGRNVGDRVSAAGYAWSTVGENIAAGQRSVAEVVAGWMASPGHCANIMTPAFRDIGVACASNSASTYGMYWTMNLAAR